MIAFPSLKQRGAGYLRNVQIQNDQVWLKMRITQHEHGLVTIQSEVEIDRHGHTIDGIVNQDSIAEVVFDQQYVNRHRE